MTAAPVTFAVAAASGDQSAAPRRPIPPASAIKTQDTYLARLPRSMMTPEYSPAIAPATPAPAFASPSASYRDPKDRNNIMGQASVIPEDIHPSAAKTIIP